MSQVLSLNQALEKICLIFKVTDIYDKENVQFIFYIWKSSKLIEFALSCLGDISNLSKGSAVYLTSQRSPKQKNFIIHLTRYKASEFTWQVKNIIMYNSHFLFFFRYFEKN